MHTALTDTRTPRTSSTDTPSRDIRSERRLDLHDDRGAQAMEYALLAGAAVVIVLVLIQLFRGEFFGGILETLVRTVIDRVVDVVSGGSSGSGISAGAGGAGIALLGGLDVPVL